MMRFVVCSLAAIVAIVVALSPQSDRLADASFAWHMVQHLLLMFVAAFFVVAATPFMVFTRYSSKAATAYTVRFTRPLHVLAHPAVALVAFVGTLWLTHFSGLYELALEHTWVHMFEHGIYFGAGVLFWIPVLAPAPVRPLPFPVRLLYLLIALPQGALVAFALNSSRQVLYRHYAVNPSALADQSNAAAVMWIAGGLVVFAAFLLTFGAWAIRESASGAPAHGGFS